MIFTPRPSQEAILRYSGGRLGIAAVPGAGKTHVLSALAAQIIQGGALQDGQEVLIVTLVNSAVDNFESRIKRFFSDNPLQALYKYRIRTLHGLAHDIVREKPARVGLEERFSIIDERDAAAIRREAVQAWLAANAGMLDAYIDPALDRSKQDWVRRQHLPEMMDSLAMAFIRSAKDKLLTPEALLENLAHAPGPLPLAEAGCAIYADYQRALAYRGAVDFDDLIRLALTLLNSDPEFLERLRYRYPFVLEDEAQDSSLTQERILSLLTGAAQGTGNWVRVGDPNQAIFETFTTASPELLRAFIRANPSVDMPESGRSQPSILDAANFLIDWTMQAHPVQSARTALSLPHIQPAPEGDPQQNPADDPASVKFIARKFTPEEELEAVAKSLKGFLDGLAGVPVEEQPTIAALVPRNTRGVELVAELRKRGIEPVELISSTTETRAAAGSLSRLLTFLADPQSAQKLAKAYEVYRREFFGTKRSTAASEARPVIEKIPGLLRSLASVEDFIAPRRDQDWLADLAASEEEAVIAELAAFRQAARRWLDGVSLPIDQLTLTLGQDIFSEPADLALAHKLALVLRQAADEHPQWRLVELTSELTLIARNERKFIGFSEDDSGFDPEKHRGRVVVTTMHRAKGLEWDRVHLLSVNNYDFPSGQPGDTFISEKWFIRGRLNLEAEALAQLSALTAGDAFGWYEEGTASRDARLDYVRERLRLFYVGITRAKKELIVTWNTGRRGDSTPSLALSALMDRGNTPIG